MCCVRALKTGKGWLALDTTLVLLLEQKMLYRLLAVHKYLYWPEV